MSDLFIIKRGDNAPSMQLFIDRADGSIPNLVGATVNLQYVESLDGVTPKTGATVITKLCTIVDATSGLIQFSFTSSDTVLAKRFIGELEVLNGATRETFPNTPNDWIEILVVQDLKDS